MASGTLALVEAYRPGLIPASAAVVALTTGAQRDLAEAGIAHTTPADHVRFGDLAETEERYTEAQRDWFAVCDARYGDAAIRPGLPLQPLHMDGYLFKIIVDSFVIESWRIAGVVRAHDPAELLLLPASPAFDRSRPIEYAESAPGNRYPYLALEVCAAVADLAGIPLVVESPGPAAPTRAGVRSLLRSTRAAAVAARLSRHRGASPSLPPELAAIEGRRVLFASEWWGLEPVLAHARATAPRTWVLADGVLFGYRGPWLTSARRVTASAIEVPAADADGPLDHGWVAMASAFAGADLRRGLARRLAWLAAWTPQLGGVAATFADVIDREGIEFVLANQRPSSMSRVLAHVATAHPGCEYLYGTHGYDTYEVDRTFLELPCDRYFTHDEEYRAYFERAFAAQSFYPIPQVEVARLG